MQTEVIIFGNVPPVPQACMVGMGITLQVAGSIDASRTQHVKPNYQSLRYHFPLPLGVSECVYSACK